VGDWSSDVCSSDLGDFDMIFITKFFKSDINYTWPQGQPPPSIQSKILGTPITTVVKLR
jgi:hypothetical protein